MIEGPKHQTNQLSTADASGSRLWVYPSDVRGKFRTRRTGFHLILLVFFISLPWVKFNGHPALLLDFYSGKFSILGFRFWAHDAPMLLFVVGSAILTLAFVTAIWGRVWCGWACPQTVFVDSVFRRIERWIEGDAVARRRLDAAPWSAAKILKKALKWSAFGVVSFLLSHSFLAYFIGTEALGEMMGQSPSTHPGSFAVMTGLTLLVFFDFGWFREQFCVLLCPYGRFQSVLMDAGSLTVAYDTKRGEPRRGVASKQGAPEGDCIHCLRCVQVCPTGIDIRNGMQLECIACTACIDACDAVMVKLHRPPGLVRYTTGEATPASSLLGNRIRPFLYLGLLGLLIGTLGWTLTRRKPLEIVLTRVIGAPYQEVSRDGVQREILNQFRIDVQNQTFASVTLDWDESINSQESGIHFIAPSFPLELKAGESKRVDLFVRVPAELIPHGRKNVTVNMRATHQENSEITRQETEVPLVGPIR